MKIHNIFIENISKRIDLKKDALKHIKVLRLKDGEHIRILDGKGNVGYGIFKGKYIDIDTIEKVKWLPNVHVYLPFVKQHAHRFILRNITSFPVKEIIFFPCKNSDINRKINENDANLLKESMKQSGNPYLPELRYLERFNDIKVFGAGYYGSMTENEFIKGAENYKEITVIIGPEGGLTEDEETILKEKGFIPVNISPATLRTEVAVFALIGARLGLCDF